MNPYGVVVGAQGSINVGALTLMTPTQGYMGSFFDAPGVPNIGALRLLDSGQVPLSETGLISVKGRINALEVASLAAGQVSVGGHIVTGPEAWARVQFGDLVNIEGVRQGNELTVTDTGEIRIVAAGDVAIEGRLAAEGADGIGGGFVGIDAGGDVVLSKGATLSARGHGEDSDGGTVDVWADNDATFGAGAVIDVRGGEVSGDGGFAELSAERTVNLEGGQFRASAIDGLGGIVVIDPDEINITVDQSFDGADHTFAADNRITVATGVTVSSRQVAAGDHGTAASTGDSGDLTFEAQEIAVGADARILAHADGGFEAGDVALTAESAGTAAISVEDAEITGGDISLTATGRPQTTRWPTSTRWR